MIGYSAQDLRPRRMTASDVAGGVCIPRYEANTCYFAKMYVHISAQIQCSI